MPPSSSSEPSQYPTGQQQDAYPPPDGPPPAYVVQQPPYGSPQQQGYYQPPPHQKPSYSDIKNPEGHYSDHREPYPTASYEQSRGGPAADYSSYQRTPPTGSHPYYNSPIAGPSAPIQGRGPSPSGDGGMSLASFFGERGPPPSWQRPPPPQFPYNQFPPMCLISNGKELSKGFPEVPPPCQLAPHPFATHDVTEEDWTRFLADVKRASSLSTTQRIKSNAIPMAAGLNILGGFFLTRAIEKKMTHKNRSAAGDVVDHWNHYFFGPRRMEAVLCQAHERLSGRAGPAPIGDPHQYHMANGLRRRTSSCSSFSSSSSSSSECARRAERRAARHERRAERKAERRERKAERRARGARSEHLEPYQLFIQPLY
ncbi:hypothetical protein F5I97DRAFT_1938131 [Phlebopus sp. FC_14]|nr:hypothetical protein F5I97DRAFT_1938131 [Phlebopus sp. FC_14]